MDNSLGTWKLNPKKSKHTPAPFPIKNLTTTRAAADGGAQVTTTGAQADGTPINTKGTVKYDGKNYPVTGAPWDTASVKQLDANIFTSTLKKARGKFHATVQTIISEDGKTMTSTVTGTNVDGTAFAASLVYDKQ